VYVKDPTVVKHKEKVSEIPMSALQGKMSTHNLIIRELIILVMTGVRI